MHNRVSSTGIISVCVYGWVSDGWAVYIDIVTVPELLPLVAAISRRGASAACLAPSVALLLLGDRIASRRAPRAAELVTHDRSLRNPPLTRVA